jgi:hypothetical protein
VGFRRLVAAGALAVATVKLLACTAFGVDEAPLDAAARDASDAAAPDAAEAAPPDARACDPDTPFGSPSPLGGPTGAWVNARLSGDELEIVFEAEDEAEGGSGKPQVWRASRLVRADGFGPPAIVTSLEDSRGSYDPDVSLDALTLVFASGRSDATGWPRDIFLATRGTRATDFGSPMVTAINSPADEAAPYLESGDAHLWFMRDSTTIWRAPRSGNTFGQPAAVSELNALGTVGFPVPSDDHTYIYFSLQDNGGSSHVWMARRTSPDGPFVRPRPVTELNSTPGESPNWLSPDGCRIYLTSDRTGSWQLYVAERSPD